jgi:putative membrane protein
MTATITTANSRISANFTGNRLLVALTVAYGLFWIAMAVAPVDRFDWFLENLLVVSTVVLLVATYRRFPFSNLTYIFLAIFLVGHTIGAHYTYSQVPFGFWLKDALHLERNAFDRIIHFSFGLLLGYPFWEFVVRKAHTKKTWTLWVAWFAVLSLSSGFEMAEWAIAVMVDPDAAEAYLGSQGDPFDAQMDSLMAIIGGAITLVITGLLSRR